MWNTFTLNTFTFNNDTIADFNIGSITGRTVNKLAGSLLFFIGGVCPLTVLGILLSRAANSHQYLVHSSHTFNLSLMHAMGGMPLGACIAILSVVALFGVISLVLGSNMVMKGNNFKLFV